MAQKVDVRLPALLEFLASCPRPLWAKGRPPDWPEVQVRLELRAADFACLVFELPDGSAKPFAYVTTSPQEEEHGAAPVKGGSALAATFQDAAALGPYRLILSEGWAVALGRPRPPVKPVDRG